MDEMEKKEELTETEAMEETAEVVEETAEVVEETTETVEETAETETVETETPKAEEETTEPAGDTEEPAAEAGKRTSEKGGILGIILGLAAFIAVLAFCWIQPTGTAQADTGVLYAKDDGLYYYDLKNEPYLLTESISDGGMYHYYYSAWGAEATENWVYYSANINEDGAFDLYRKAAKDMAAEAVCIDSDVYDYTVSEDGEVVAYLAMHGDSLELCTYAGEKVQVVADGLQLENDVYNMSGDGKYLVYTDAYDMLCAVTVGSDAAAEVLTEESPMYLLAEDTLYYVAQGESVYNIYSYDFKNDPVLIAENAVYMVLMPNGRDLLYGKTPDDVIPYADIIEDDMAEADALLQEGDEGYEEKVQREEIREAMKNGEGIQPILQEYYVVMNGKSVKVADNVISAIAADSETSFVTGYRAKEMEKILLSEVSGGVDSLTMQYYMNLNYGGFEPFLADTQGNLEVLNEGVAPDTIQISKDGKYAAYLDSNSKLMKMSIGKAAEAAEFAGNVENFAFLGNKLGYAYDYENGVGKIGTENTEPAENACGITFAEDEEAVYFIQNPDSETGNGKLCVWKKDAFTDMDEDVFAFQYKGNGKLVYLKNYDVTEGKGDLYYYDGKESRLLDTGITAIFMY